MIGGRFRGFVRRYRRRRRAAAGQWKHRAPPLGLRLPSTTTTTTAWMRVLEGPRPAAESLAVPAWLLDDPELRRRGITLVECLRPVSSL